MGTKCCMAIWRPFDIRRWQAATMGDRVCGSAAQSAYARMPRHSAISYRVSARLEFERRWLAGGSVREGEWRPSLRPNWKERPSLDAARIAGLTSMAAIA
jgi:hypothetical protein